MNEIIPAILPKDFLEIQIKTAQVKNVSKLIQIDLCDGIYVPSQTWPFNGTDRDKLQIILNQEDGLPFWQEVSFELDLMIKNAHKNFDNWVMLGPSRIVFHLEAEDESFLSWFENLDIFYKEQIEIGIAISTETNTEKLIPFIEHIKFIQCMGIDHEGKQGEQLDRRVFKQLETLRQKYPHMPLSVDGAVSFDSINELLEAGANRLIIGSAIFNSIDPEESVKKLYKLVKNIV